MKPKKGKRKETKRENYQSQTKPDASTPSLHPLMLFPLLLAAPYALLVLSDPRTSDEAWYDEED